MKFVWIVISLSLLSCSSKSKITTPTIEAPKAVTKALPPPRGYEPPTIRALTNVGENHHPHINSDGTRLLFESRKRATHAQSQIYELDLTTGASRRITFHDGDATNASYLPAANGLVYASTTDELKEDPKHLLQLLARYRTVTRVPNSESSGTLLPPQELYLSRLDGSWIKRLTFNPGYDGRPAAHPTKPLLVYETQRGEKLTELGQLIGTKLTPTKFARGKRSLTEPQFSPKGEQIAWIETDGTTSSIWLAKENGNGARALELPKAVYHDVTFSPNEELMVFSANLEAPQNFELYSYELKSKCLKRLTYDEATEAAPVFRPDGKELIFASNRSSQFQLYMMDFKPPKDCLSL